MLVKIANQKYSFYSVNKEYIGGSFTRQTFFNMKFFLLNCLVLCKNVCDIR